MLAATIGSIHLAMGTLIGWLIFGPRPRTTWSTTALSFIWPVAILVGTSSWRDHRVVPIPFVDVTMIGFADAVRNSAVILAAASYRCRADPCWITTCPRLYETDGPRSRADRSRPSIAAPLTNGSAAAHDAYRESVDTARRIVIGAGLAGLRGASDWPRRVATSWCSRRESVVGGRQRTDAVDGFLLDRGFQILNPAYPAVKRWVDVAELQLQHFPVGVRVRRESDSVELTASVRHPRGIPATLRSGLISPRALTALVRWLAPVLLRPRSVITGTDRTAACAMGSPRSARPASHRGSRAVPRRGSRRG